MRLPHFGFISSRTMNNSSSHEMPIAVFAEPHIQPLSWLALAAIAAYKRVLSPVLLSIWGPACRFEPTCSVYAAQAIARYGFLIGSWVALKRLISCRPLGRWGFDPLPAERARNELTSAGLKPRSNKRKVIGQ